MAKIKINKIDLPRLYPNLYLYLGHLRNLQLKLTLPLVSVDDYGRRLRVEDEDDVMPLTQSYSPS